MQPLLPTQDLPLRGLLLSLRAPLVGATTTTTMMKEKVLMWLSLMLMMIKEYALYCIMYRDSNGMPFIVLISVPTVECR